jgi:hypothetical protein
MRNSDDGTYHSQFRKYLGHIMFSLVLISESIAESPMKMYSKISEVLIEGQKVLKKIMEDR